MPPSVLQLKTNLNNKPLTWEIPLIGHRGAAALAPENTLAGLLKAKQLGLTWIEFDVMLSRDGVPVVIHDATLKRTTNSSGRVSAKTCAQLESLDAGAWFSRNYAGEKIPRLDAYLKAASQNGLNVNVELKPVVKDEKLTAKMTLKAVAENYDSNKLEIIISSFSETMLQQVRKLDKNIKLAFLMHRWRRDYAVIAKKLACCSIHVNQACLSFKRAQEIKLQGYALLAYTVNDLTRMKELLSWGVDAVFSDMPKGIVKSIAVKEQGSGSF